MRSKNRKYIASLIIPSFSKNTIQITLEELNKNILTFKQGNLTMAF